MLLRNTDFNANELQVDAYTKAIILVTVGTCFMLMWPNFYYAARCLRDPKTQPLIE